MRTIVCRLRLMPYCYKNMLTKELEKGKLFYTKIMQGEK